MAGRWMLFVDGENLTIRAQKVMDGAGQEFTEGLFWLRDTFVWLAQPQTTNNYMDLRAFYGLLHERVSGPAIRRHYYTSVFGDQPKLDRVRATLWDIGFKPSVFKKESKTRRSKGVDIALATDMLGHAFRDNYDLALLVAGDGDYVPLVEEIQRLGKIVCVSFFQQGLSEQLTLASDSPHRLAAGSCLVVE